MTYFPDRDLPWERVTARRAGFDAGCLDEAVAFAEGQETAWPRDLDRAGALPGLTAVEPPPWNEVLGPLAPRGGPNGLILRAGRRVAAWGDIARADMTFSVAKSYLAVLAGLALGDGLIGGLDELVAARVPGANFAAPQNRSITWRHLLNQTSEWEGTLWDKPDLVDRNRQLGPDGDNSRKGQHRDLQPPGGYWEYNDVRVNLLALSLLQIFRRPLPAVLKARVMGLIGASEDWRWHGYRNSFVEIDGQRLQSVPGGSHWGGGLQISSLDHARFGLLVQRAGVWNGVRILPEGWTGMLRRPCPLNDGYGFLWWLNCGRRAWPTAPESAFAAIGAGSNIVWIDPDHDLILVARWIDETAVEGLIERLMAALA
jgi:CubicO group peptidase (beta-lactamase class C family)